MSTEHHSLTPKGFRSYATHAGIKADKADFGLVIADRPCQAAALFTQNTFCGPCVTVGRNHIQSGTLQALVVTSGNANVANGEQGLRDVHEICDRVAKAFGIDKTLVLPSSTGVIGRPMPMDKVRAALEGVENKVSEQSFDGVAHAMLTTDRNAKVRSVRVGNAVLTGMIKGAGMIEPNMATLLCYFFTDAQITGDILSAMFKRAIGASLNMISVDTDTSTSDTAAIFASGAAGAVDAKAFEQALTTMAVQLGQDLLLDAEGASKLIEVCVKGARSDEQARKLAKSIVNSPLVKTAVHGADPNWGRVMMALGKTQDPDVVAERLSVRFGDIVVYDAKPVGGGVLEPLRAVLSAERVRIEVDLKVGPAQATAWGCDLTEEYIRINALYTT